MDRLILIVASGFVLFSLGCAGTQSDQSSKAPLFVADKGGTIPLEGGEKLVCEKVTVTGSRVAQKVCRLQSLRDQDEQEAEDLIRRSRQTRGHIGQ